MSGSPVKISTARQVNYSEGMPDNLVPTIGYQYNLGSPFKKWLGIYGAELNVETLVAQDTIATIGGRILVGPTTSLTADISASSVNLFANLNPGFEISGSGGGDVFANWQEFPRGSDIYRSSADKHSGTYGCKLSTGSFTSASSPYVEQTMAVVPNSTYVMGVWVNNYVFSGSSFVGKIQIYDNTNASLIYNNLNTASSGLWIQMSKVFTVPTGCSSISFRLFGCDALSNFITYDDFSLIQDTIYVKNNEMAQNDIVYLEGGGKVEFMQVLSPSATGSGPYSYVVQRDLDGTGLNSWSAGDAVFNTGIIGDGFIDLYSQHGIKAPTQFGPSIVGNVRSSLVYNDYSPRWAIGNLNGIYDYSAGSRVWGAIFGAYASGSSNITIDDVNGIRIRNFTNNIITLNNSGSAFIDGRLNMTGYAGAIAIGGVPPSGSSTGTGIWIDRTGLYGMKSNVVQSYIDASGILYGGMGTVVISSSGIVITDPSSIQKEVRWTYGGNYIGGVFADNTGGTDTTTWLRSYRKTGSTWEKAVTVLLAQDDQNSKDVRVAVEASGSGGVITLSGADLINIPSGSIVGSMAVAARIYRTTNQTIPDNSLTSVQFDRIRFNQGCTVDPTITSASTPWIGFDYGGTYLFTANVRFAANNTGRRGVVILLNSASQIVNQQVLTSGSNAPIILNVSTIYNIAFGDYVELQVFQNSGGNLDITPLANATTEFAVARLS